MTSITIGLLGLGTVGQGVLEILANNQDEIVRHCGSEILVSKALVKDLTKKRVNAEDIELTVSSQDITLDDNIDIVVEVMGGENEARDYILEAIAHNKHVVTSNKAVIAKHGNEIFKAAKDKGVIVAYEGAVAGGIPIIKALKEGLSSNKIKSIAGIINGTCNYILSKMTLNNESFSDALKAAQDKGFAEADPSFDIGGIDAAHKITILANIAFGIPLSFDNVYIEGIEDITSEDIHYAKRFGFAIKHLAIARKREEGIELRVHPAMVPLTETLSHVQGEMNAVSVTSDAVGHSLYYGPGAGSLPTASAVIADLIDIVKFKSSKAVLMASPKRDATVQKILSIDEVLSEYYLKLDVMDQAGVLSDITQIFATNNISIDSIMQIEKASVNGFVPIVIITHMVIEKDVNDAIESLKKLQTVSDTIRLIRLERHHRETE